MRIIEVDLNNLKPYKNNAKIHTKKQIEEIKNSIQEFGYNDLIAVNTDLVIIEGHGRYTALKELGFNTIKVLLLEHLSELEQKAYIIAHNKICLNTSFDFEELKKELKNILENDNKINITDFGLDLSDLEDFKELETEFLGKEETKKVKLNNTYICPCCNKSYRIDELEAVE